MEVQCEGEYYEVDPDYSFKDFTGWDLSNHKDLNGRIIYGSCFSQETPDRMIFPITMMNVTFVKCNLDNCFIPNGNPVLYCSMNRFKAQEDGKDWEVNILGMPTKKKP